MCVALGGEGGAVHKGWVDVGSRDAGEGEGRGGEEKGDRYGSVVGAIRPGLP